MVEAADPERMDFFISYAGPDQDWATWIAWHLRKAGFSVEMGVFDWAAGDNAVERMGRGLDRVHSVVMVWSAAYFDPSSFATDEWQSVLSDRPDVRKRLIPLRVEEVTPPRLLRGVVYRDLFGDGLDEAAAREVLLAAVKGASWPSEAPRFPSPRPAGLAPPTDAVVIDPPLGELPILRGREDAVAGLVSASGVHVVTGMGGCGKTTVALAVADAVWAAGGRVWWVSAADPGSLVAGMVAVAEEAGGSPREVAEAVSDVAAARLVWRVLGSVSARWLLVLDNADDPDLLAVGGRSVASGFGWVRAPGVGLVVVTSRVSDAAVWGRTVRLHPLPVLDPATGGQMILDRVPHADADHDETTVAAQALSTRLGHLPLALHLAGSYLGSGVATVDLDGYRQALDTSSVRLLAGLGGSVWTAQDPRREVVQTWELSLDGLAARGVGQARDLLRLLAYFAAGAPIPVSMLDPELIAGGGLVDPAADGGASVRAGLAGLKSVGLLDSAPLGPAGDGVVMHPLVAEVSRWHADTARVTSHLIRTVIALLATASDRLDPDLPADRVAWQLLAPHARAVLDVVASVDDAWTARLVAVGNLVVQHLTAAGSYAAAVQLGVDVDAAAGTLLDDEHPNTLTSRNNLAGAYRAAGRLAEAIPLYEATLAAFERVLGVEHPNTLRSRNNLAGAYDAAGRLAEAIPLYEVTLAAGERVLGVEHPDTLISRSNVAGAYQAAGRLAEAIPLFEATLAAREGVLGVEHPDTLGSRSNLAGAYGAAGRLAEAIPLYEATLVVCERVVGVEHPDTLRSRSNLAGAYQDAGRLAEAVSLLEASLAACERVLGVEHPNTLITRNNLATAYQTAGRLAEAIPLLEVTLTDSERVLGVEHPGTLISRRNLADAYRVAGRLAEAIPLLEAALAACERVLGVEHPDTLGSRSNLATAYQAAGRLAEAIPLLEATLAAREGVLGVEHPGTLASRNNLAGAYGAAGRLAEAIPLLEATLADSERVVGVEHPDTLRARNNLANAYGAAGRLADAISLLETTVAACERVLGVEHPNTLTARNNLASAYQAAARLTDE